MGSGASLRRAVAMPLTIRKIQVERPGGIQLAVTTGTRDVRQCTLAGFVVNRATTLWLETNEVICSPVGGDMINEHCPEEALS